MRVTADAAYDTVAVYETAGARGTTVVVPPARTANVMVGEDCQEDKAQCDSASAGHSSESSYVP